MVDKNTNLLVQSTCILIPALNPDEILSNLIIELKKRWTLHGLATEPSIVIVNDGSWSHESVTIFENLSKITGIFVLNLAKNVGKGAAIKMGLEYIQNEDISYIVTADADGQHSVDDIYKVLTTSILREKFVIGVRELSSFTVPLKSLVGNICSRIIFFLTTGRSLKDTQSGLRAFSKRSLPKMLQISGSRYEYEMAVLMHFFNNKFENTVDVSTAYFDKNKGSFFRPFKDSILVYSVFFNYCFVSIVITTIDFILIYLGSILFPTISSFVAIRLVTSHVYFLALRTKAFRMKNNVFPQLIKFYFLLAINISISSFLFNYLYYIGNYGFFIGYFTAATALFVFNFIIQKKVVFT